jgi:hypothetical protein
MASTIKVNTLDTNSGSDITIAATKKIAGANTQFKITGGATGQVLSTDGAGALSWAAKGVGKIGQVLQAFKTDTFSMNAGAWTDITGLSQAITPVATTSKILVMGHINDGGSHGETLSHHFFRLMRDSSAVGIGDTASNRLRATYQSSHGSASALANTCAFMFLDEPSSTSALTYKMQCWSQNGSGYTLWVNRTGTDTDSTNYARSTSSITVMEILV